MVNSESTIEEIISRVCTDLREVQGLIRVKNDRRDLWSDTIFPGLHLSPILGDLLSMRQQQSNEAGSISRTLEAFRLAAVLYTCYLREKFGIDTLSGRPLYASKLRACIPSLQPEELPFDLLVWILCVAYTSGFSEQNRWFGERLQVILAAQNITNFDDLKVFLILLVWDEDILSTQSQYLRTLFESEGS
jgi:hypothetical protein